MSISNTDFTLTTEQLQTLNEYISRLAARHAGSDEPNASTLTVKFEWMAGLGRSVTAFLDGHVDGCVIEDCLV